MLHSLLRHGQQLFASSSLRAPPFSVFALDYVQEPPCPNDCGLTNREAFAKISHEVQSYTALAVVSAVFASSNLGALRTIDEALVSSGGFLIELIVSFCLAAAAFLSLYSTMVSSLLRYYGYISIAQGTATTWVSICIAPPMILIKKTCFWAFIGAFGLSVLEIAIVIALKFNEYGFIKAALILVAVIAGMGFMMITLYILAVARWLFGPQLLHQSDEDVQAMSVDISNFTSSVAVHRPDARWSAAINGGKRPAGAHADHSHPSALTVPIDQGTLDGDMGDCDGGTDDL